jgi:hypothetical protein
VFNEGDRPAVAAPVSESPYPRELVRRPLTAAAAMSEAGLTALLVAEPFELGGELRARHGVSRRVELGLRYGTGALHDGEFLVGKALAPELGVALHRHVAVQVALPLLLSPFSLGAVVGAPVRLPLGERLAFIAGRELLGVRLKRFLPSTRSAAQNEHLADLDESRTQLPDGQFNLTGEAIYQHSPVLALELLLGVQNTFGGGVDADSWRVPLHAGLLYSLGERVDLQARAGFGTLKSGESFTLSAGLAVRLLR